MYAYNIIYILKKHTKKNIVNKHSGGQSGQGRQQKGKNT